MRIPIRTVLSILATGAVTMLFCTACGSAPSPQASSQTAASVPTPAAEGPRYRIGVGDLLRISVWKEPELDVTTAVRPDGWISVPLLGDQQAAGLTVEELRRSLAGSYGEFVTSPTVSVVVAEIHSRQFYISGEVNGPGTYPMQGETRLMQAIAMAGGLSPYAKKKVIVLRNQVGRQRRIEVDLQSIISGQHPAANLILEPGDTLIVR